MDFIKQVIADAEDILERSPPKKLTYFEALQIAVKIQQNRLFSEAFMLPGDHHPTALEGIGMQLGMAGDDSTIKGALFDIASALNEIARAYDSKENMD